MISSLLSLDLPQNILLADFHLGRFVLQILLFVLSLWLIFLILIQRGKGGGLTGALGGSGGSSAFGAKAGDAFTKVTVVSATIWILLCMVTIASINRPPPPEQAINNDAKIGGSADDSESMGDPARWAALTDTDTSEGMVRCQFQFIHGRQRSAADDAGEPDTSNDFVPSGEASGDAEEPAMGDASEDEDAAAVEDAPEAEGESTDEDE